MNVSIITKKYQDNWYIATGKANGRNLFGIASTATEAFINALKS